VSVPSVSVSSYALGGTSASQSAPTSAPAAGNRIPQADATVTVSQPFVVWPRPESAGSSGVSLDVDYPNGLVPAQHEASLAQTGGHALGSAGIAATALTSGASLKFLGRRRRVGC
jgi:hypothetical protein